MKLESAAVSRIYFDSLAGEDCASPLAVKGIVHEAAFDPDKLASHKDEVRALLAQLPDQFHETLGGGWSFLNSCQDRDGDFWTGLHLVMEQLVLMGLGLGLVEFPMEREFWPVMPGGMPYFVFKDAAI
mgnify:CR=1 FL=1